MSVYDELEAAVLPRMTAFQTDLTKWDRAVLEKHPGCLFLHYHCDSNTYLILLMPPEEYPKDGEWVPYLFSQADRWHIVKQVTEMAEYYLQASTNPERYTCHYFDGKRLRKIDKEEAKRIAWVYRRGIESGWKAKMVAA